MAGTERAMPHNVDAEKGVLGAMLLNRDAAGLALEKLVPDDFYRDSHKLIYEAMLAISHNPDQDKRHISLNSVYDHMERVKTLDKLSDISELTSLTDVISNLFDVRQDIAIVREKSELRNLISASIDMMSAAYDAELDAREIIDKAEQRILEISSRNSHEGITPTQSIVMEAVDKIQEMVSSDKGITGLETQFTDLNNMTHGLQDSDFILVAARPSMGKTAFTLNIAAELAIEKELPVVFFSLEMSAVQLMLRIISSGAGINLQDLHGRDTEEGLWERLTAYANKVYNAPLYIDDTPGMSVLDIRAKARRLKAEKGLKCVMIDYLQLMQGRSSKEGRQQEVSEISRSLKQLARELNIPVITLSQLNRSVESRQEKRPMLSDLRESGSLEQDADIVMFLYRDDYYNEKSEIAGITEVIISKHRNGPVGTVRLGFNKQFTRFENLDLFHK